MGRIAACPEVVQYERLAAGQVAEAEKETLLDHLEHCDTCAQKMASLREPDRLVSVLRHADKLAEASLTLVRLVERLSKLRPGESPLGQEQTMLPGEPGEAPRMTFACPACDKAIQVKADLAGKKGKCPHCKQAVRVPATAAGVRKRDRHAAAPPAAGTMAPQPGGRQEKSTLGGVNSLSRITDSSADQPQPANAKKTQHYDFLAPPQAADELGRLGPYRVLQVLGAGGMGVVFRAEDPQLQRIVALKAMLPALAASASARQRFVGEARAAAAIKHDHIVTIHQVGEDRGVPFLAMEFLEGEPLDARLERQGKLAVADVVAIGREIALGLAAAHKRGLIHRDIKPANIWLEAETARVKILDFGLARAVGQENHLTQLGAIIGTPAYMAPEQAQGGSLDARCDLFSLGCVLYRLATGEPAFRGNDVVSMLLAVATERPRPPQELEAALPPALSKLIMDLLAKNPDGRPASAHAVAEALERLPHASAAGPAPTKTPGVVRPKLPPPTAYPGPAKFRSWRAAAAVLGLALALLLAAGYWLGGLLVRVKTPEGLLVVNVDEPDADVYVDGHKAVVTWDEGRKKAEIKVKPGTNEVQVKVVKQGFEMEGGEVTLKVQGRRVFNAKLIRKAPAAEPPTPAAAGFVRLFNGKDLTGWKALASGKATWEVQDGVLIGRGGKGSLFNDGKSYENFHLRVEAMINDAGVSGIFFRAPFGPTTPRGDPEFGCEARINITNKDPVKTGSLFFNNILVVQSASPPIELDQWFTLEVIADGPQIVVKVNGKQTAYFVDLETGSRIGRVALRVLDAAALVKYRKVEIKELPPSNLRVQYLHGGGGFEQVKGNLWLERNGGHLQYWHDHARGNIHEGGHVWFDSRTADNKRVFCHITRGNGGWLNFEGSTRWTRIFSGGWSTAACSPPAKRSAEARPNEWVPLLNGKDLGGWETNGRGDPGWKYEGDALVGRSSTDQAGLLLSSRADYDNFHLRMETQLCEGGFGSLFLRCGPYSDGLAGNKTYAIRIGADQGVSPATGSLVLSAHFDESVPFKLADAAAMPLTPGEWFPLEIMAEGNRLRVLVNGKTAVDYKDANATFTSGRLGLVCRGKAAVRFRKMELKELSTSR